MRAPGVDRPGSEGRRRGGERQREGLSGGGWGNAGRYCTAALLLAISRWLTVGW
jgi:hypothetical protein